MESVENLVKYNMTAENILEKLTEALTRFGTYSFDDKGPYEVMNITPITKFVKT